VKGDWERGDGERGRNGDKEKWGRGRNGDKRT